MKTLDIILLFVAVVIVAVGGYIVFNNFSGNNVKFQPYYSNISGIPLSGAVQFYPNLRFSDSSISYSINPSCDDKRRSDSIEAFNILQSSTSLTFNEVSNDGKINILCSDVAPRPEEKGHFVAGEGGPSEVINASIYSVIISSKVSLYRQDRCDKPQIALHEILHALGFDHIANQSSIMYPVTDCNQVLDEEIISKINELYSIPSEPDLAIDKVNANSSGRYVNFDISVSNYGLKTSSQSTLELYGDDSKIKDFDLGTINIGTKKFLSVTNIRVPSSINTLKFVVKSNEHELSDSNNVAVIQGNL